MRDDMGTRGNMRIDPDAGQTRVHHPDRETGAPVVSTLDEFAKHAAAYLLRLRRTLLWF